jgi:hypothetical protein
VTSSSAAALIEMVIGEDRWAPKRLAGLGPAERRLYEFMLRRFADGEVPSPAEVASLDETGEAIRMLVERDLVGLGRRNEVALAYPFSARPTRHRVELADGRRYWAMCAIDALGIPYLANHSGAVHASEPNSDRAISVEIDPDAPSPGWTPAEAVVVAASSGSGCVSGCACPHINLFASSAAAERYLATPGLRGTILTVPEATDAGRELFGDLLERLADIPEP